MKAQRIVKDLFDAFFNTPAACLTAPSGASRNGAAAIPSGPASSPTTSPA